MPSDRAEYRRFELDRKKNAARLERAAADVLLSVLRDMKAKVARGVSPTKALPRATSIDAILIPALAPPASMAYNEATRHGLEQAQRYLGRPLPIFRELQKSIGTDVRVLKVTEEDVRSLGINTTRETVFEEATFGKIKTIAPNFIDSLRAMVDASIAASESRPQLIKRLTQFEGQTKRTAQRIAQTETTRLFNDGKLRGYKKSTVVQGKMWQSNMFGNPRPAHKAANGQVVPIEEKFSVMGEMLDYPGDPAGSAKNVINCYCSIRPVVRPSKASQEAFDRSNREAFERSNEAAYDSVGQVGPVGRKAYEKTMKLEGDTVNGILRGGRKKGVDGMTRADLQRHIVEQRKQMDALRFQVKEGLEKYSGNSLAQYYDMEKGAWLNTPEAIERRALHEKLARAQVDKGTIAKAGEGRILATGGYPGSGKSTMLNQAFPGWKEKYVHLDADFFKEKLVEADGLSGIGFRAAAYHEESDMIAKRAFEIALQENRNILYDGTMKSGGKIRKLITVHPQYTYDMAFADLPMDKAMERAIGRSIGSDGRWVDPAYISIHEKKNLASFESLKESIENTGGGWSRYNTDGPAKSPAELIEESKKTRKSLYKPAVIYHVQEKATDAKPRIGPDGLTTSERQRGFKWPYIDFDERTIDRLLEVRSSK